MRHLPAQLLPLTFLAGTATQDIFSVILRYPPGASRNGAGPTHIRVRGTLNNACFPTTAMVSMRCVMKDGDAAEIAVIGTEGLVGISLYMGGGSAPRRAVVQNGSQGFRMKAQALKSGV